LTKKVVKTTGGVEGVSLCSPENKQPWNMQKRYENTSGAADHKIPLVDYSNIYHFSRKTFPLVVNCLWIINTTIIMARNPCYALCCKRSNPCYEVTLSGHAKISLV
jgi:hypothetical protein